MSSATSIKPTSKPLAVPRERDAARDGFKPWHFFVLLSLLAATAAVVVSRQPAPEQLVLLSLTIGAAGLCGGALFAALAPLVRTDQGIRSPALSERTRDTLEREKMLVLRSIKELEFDRAMGKLSAADFDEVAGRLRARAISLMKQLDAGTPVYRTRIEEELASRLRSADPAAQTCTCGTSNDADAVYCKRCGRRLRPERGGPASLDC